MNTPLDWLRVLLPPLFWGLSFVTIRVGLESFSPFTLGAIRFFLAGFPLILFYKFPALPRAKLITYCVSIGVLQYGLMFFAIHLKLPAGLSSVLIQVQVYITIAGSFFLFGERIQRLQILGFVISAAGLIVIGRIYFLSAEATAFILILSAAAFWSAGNLLLKTMKVQDFAGFVAWTSFLSSIPLAAAALAMDTPEKIVHQLVNASLRSWLAIGFMSIFATHIAFTLFSKMLLRLPAHMVMPFATLVPVFGLASTAIFLGETLKPEQQIGAVLVIAGLIVAVALQQITKRRSRVLAGLLLAITVAGCTKTFSKIAYNTLLPRIALSRTDSFFDLNSEQKTQTKAIIARTLAWHRSTQLALYAQDLELFKVRFGQGLKDADLTWLIDVATRHRNALFRRIIPEIIPLLQSLSPEQITHFKEKLAEQNAELKKKLERPLAERQKEEFETIIDRLEEWTGNLTADQKRVLEVQYRSVPDSAMQWLLYREEQQANFIQLLGSKPDAKTLNTDLEGRMIYQERNLPKRFQSSFARTALIMRKVILNADAILSAEQKAKVIRKSDEYLQIIRDLSKG